MEEKLSIAEARDGFTRLVRRVERGRPVQLTRRGKPVAVLVSIAEYERLITQEEGFGRRLRAFLESVDREVLVGDDPFAGLRDDDAGRDVAL